MIQTTHRHSKTKAILLSAILAKIVDESIAFTMQKHSFRNETTYTSRNNNIINTI